MKTSAFIWVVAVSLATATSDASDSSGGIERIKEAQLRWELLGATSFSYDLGKSIGSPFGYGEFHVKVRGGKCLARHYAGVGFGRPKFWESLRYRPCEGMLPGDLMAQVAGEVAHGRQLVHFEVHPTYGFAVSVGTDTDQPDASWSYEIKHFKLKAASLNGRGHR